MAESRKFIIDCEFELFGKELNNVVTSCPQLNIHTAGDSIQTAMDKLAEAVKFFFDTAEARHEFPAVLEALERDNLEIPPWWPGVKLPSPSRPITYGSQTRPEDEPD